MAYDPSKILAVFEEKPAQITIPQARVWDDESIRKELEHRESIDTQLRVERQAALDQMFPNRTNGALYREEVVQIDDYDF